MTRWTPVTPYTLRNRSFHSYGEGKRCYAVVTPSDRSSFPGFAPGIIQALYLMPATARKWREKHDLNTVVCEGTFDGEGNIRVTFEQKEG